jgi:hypothetical protein
MRAGGPCGGRGPVIVGCPCYRRVLLETSVRAGAPDGVAETPEFVLLGLARKNRVPSSPAAHAPCREAGDVYDSHTADLYRQALLTLGDASLAEQVVMSVIVDECMQPAAADADADAAAARMAVSTYWRCQELANERGQRNWSGTQLVPAVSASGTGGAILSARERGALGLVLFGGLGYVQAAREMAIPPRDLAVVLCTALRRLAAPASSSVNSAST